MDGERVRNLKITGSGSSSGGLYEKVAVVGEGAILDDLDCLGCKTQGTSRFSGDVKCGSFHVSGTAEVEGRMRAELMKIFGEAKIVGDATVKEARIRGSVETKAGLTAESIDLRGLVAVEGNCEAEEFAGKGGFRIGGLLNAGVLEMKLKFPSSAREIGGERIHIERDRLPFGLNKMWKSGKLEVDTIEGDDIDIEFTTAKIVRGNRVRIGPGCEVDVVEYKNHIDISPESHIKEQRQV
ncbi:MAG TPA: hypothetical protein VFK37_06840 [Bacillales bacterium]|nr:hypothetical protein [Bacillales bacterium]